MITRRDFLKNASLLTLGGFLAGKTNLVHAAQPAVSSVEEAMKAKRIGLQIYSLGGELYEDVAGGLQRLGKMGYKTLELAGFGNKKIRGVPMMDFKKMTEDAGMEIISSHVNPPIRNYNKSNIEKVKDFWKQSAADHHELGLTYVVQPGQPSIKDKEDAQYVGEVFNEAGKIMKDAGIKFGYHNHAGEFDWVPRRGTDKDKECKYDLMVNNTDPSLVLFELDVYWAVMGRVDPVEYMRKYADRIQLLHIKDRKVLGESGMMNFEQIFKQFYANGHKDYFVELEGIGKGKQFEGIEGCINYLKKSKFVK